MSRQDMQPSIAPSRIMQTWQAYTATVKGSNTRRIERKPGANYIYLSEATGCPRKATLRLAKYPAAPYSAQSTLNIAAGMKGEEKVALVLAASGWEIERQRPVRTKYGNGKIDIYALPQSDLSNRFDPPHLLAPCIVEVKTTTMDALKWLPRAEHVDQALLYLGFEAGADRMPIDEIEGLTSEVVYLLRPTLTTGDPETGHDGVEKIAAFPVQWDRARFERLIATLDAIDETSRRRALLDIPEGYTPTSVPCEYPTTGRCVYWSHCWGNVHNTIADQRVRDRYDNVPVAAPALRDSADDATVEI